jgi:hypothetical protein
VLTDVLPVAINSDPEPNSWGYDASAWACAWLTARGRAMIAPREMLLRPEWRGQVEWREHYEPRKRGHRPDLAIRLSSGGVLPVEVELTDKSPARLKALLTLYRQWVLSGLSSGVIYICANQHLAERVRTTGEDAKLSIERKTLRVELLDTIKRQALDARGGAAAQDWGTIPIKAAASRAHVVGAPSKPGHRASKARDRCTTNCSVGDRLPKQWTGDNTVVRLRSSVAPKPSSARAAASRPRHSPGDLVMAKGTSVASDLP